MAHSDSQCSAMEWKPENGYQVSDKHQGANYSTELSPRFMGMVFLPVCRAELSVSDGNHNQTGQYPDRIERDLIQHASILPSALEKAAFRRLIVVPERNADYAVTKSAGATFSMNFRKLSRRSVPLTNFESSDSLTGDSTSIPISRPSSV